MNVLDHKIRDFVREREVRDFVRAALEIQHVLKCSIELAKQEAAKGLGCPVPSEAEFTKAVSARGRRMRGRPKKSELSRRDAVGAVAAYFESIGARPEQAIKEAKHWLGIRLSRRVAKVGIATFKANTSLEQFRPLAIWAYATFKKGVTLPLPEVMHPAQRKRRRKSDLG